MAKSGVKRLLIYGGDGILSNVEADAYYSLKGGIVEDLPCINNPKRLHDIALEIRDDYMSFLGELNGEFIDAGLTLENKLSLFFLSDISNTRSEVWDTFPLLCALMELRELASGKGTPKEVELRDCPSAFIKAWPSLGITATFYQTGIEPENKSSKMRRSLSDLRYWLKLALVRLLCPLIRFLTRRKRLKVFRGFPPEKRRLFVSRYPLHFFGNGSEEKYGGMAGKTDRFLVNIATDGMHQDLPFKEIPGVLWKAFSDERFFILDDKVKFRDIVLGLKIRVKIFNAMHGILGRVRIFNGVSIGALLDREMELLPLRAPRLMVYFNPLRQSFQQIGPSEVVFYLHEYCYGRLISFVLQSYFPGIRSMGFQHGTVARRKLVIYSRKTGVGSAGPLLKCPDPKGVYVEDADAAEVYLEAGYKNIKILDRIYRIAYLDTCKWKGKGSDRILVVLGLHDGVPILKKLKGEIEREKEKTFAVRPHPRANLMPLKMLSQWNFPNIEIDRSQITEALERSEEIIVTYSSVGDEARKIGAPVRVIVLPGSINEAVALDHEGYARISWN